MSEQNNILNKFELFNDVKNKEIIKHVKNFYLFKDIENGINAIIITKDDIVYAIGSNFDGILGLGHEREVKELTIIAELCHKNVIEVSNSKFHAMALTISGNVYCWGSNWKGVLGQGRDDDLDDENKPKLNEYLKNKQIISICCGERHSLVLTKDGKVYSWGDNSKGQIGNRMSGIIEYQTLPYFVDEFKGKKVTSISCGYWFSMTLTQSGTAYSWGSNECGQLGRKTGAENPSNCPNVVAIASLKRVIFDKISCGRECSLLLSREGEIYVFGTNDWTGDNTIDLRQPLQFNLLNNKLKFTEIASHYDYNFSSFLSSNGLYYIWGNYGKEEVIKVPMETLFKSFDDIFNQYFGITYKIITMNEEVIEKVESNQLLKDDKSVIERHEPIKQNTHINEEVSNSSKSKKFSFSNFARNVFGNKTKSNRPNAVLEEARNPIHQIIETYDDSYYSGTIDNPFGDENLKMVESGSANSAKNSSYFGYLSSNVNLK